MKNKKSLKEFLITIDRFKKLLHLHQKTESEPKPEESIAERVKLRRQKFEEKEFKDFLRQIKEEQKNVDMSLFRSEFIYEMPH